MMAEMTDSISRRKWLHCAGLSYLSGGALQAWGREGLEEGGKVAARSAVLPKNTQLSVR